MIESIQQKDFDLMCASVGNVLEDVTLQAISRGCCFKRANEKIWSGCCINEWKWSNCIWNS